MTDLCPLCGRPVVDFDAPPSDTPTCNPIRSPECWKVIGKSKNGGPLLRIVENDRV